MAPNKKAVAKQAPPLVEITHEVPVSWLAPIGLFRTAIFTVLAKLFGSYADKREVLAALDPQGANVTEPVHQYIAEIDPKKIDAKTGLPPKKSPIVPIDEVWFDYIADTGDGWNATYSIACLATEAELQVGPEPGSQRGEYHTLPRGRFVVLGGDQVYPTASSESYLKRLENPFYCAWADARPRYEAGLETRKLADDVVPTEVYALPGNHDWYDGLTSFIRLFGQHDRWVGPWMSRQTRSYFAIQLPHRWWIWGIDVQLQSDLDPAQVDYFKNYADMLKEGDRVILCSPEPTWIVWGQTDQDPRRDRGVHGNLYFLEKIIKERTATIPVRIAGDWHHYVRYEGDNKNEQLITCGGGGAYLAGTLGMPKTLNLKISFEDQFTRQAAYPDHATTSVLHWGVWSLFKDNKSFALMLGLSYAFYAWVLQFGSRALPFYAPDDKNALYANMLEYFRRAHRSDFTMSLWCAFPLAWWHTVIRDLLSLLMTLAIVFGCIGFAKRSLRPNTPSWAPVTAGLLHGVLHISLAVALFGGWAYVGGKYNTIAPDAGGQLLNLFCIAVSGFVLGPLLMAAYLWLTNAIYGGHDEEVIAAQAIEDYKCFTRFHLTKDALTIYPIGLTKACKEWELDPNVKDMSPRKCIFDYLRFWRPRRFILDVPDTVGRVFRPKTDLEPQLIEAPIEIKNDAPPPARRPVRKRPA